MLYLGLHDATDAKASQPDGVGLPRRALARLLDLGVLNLAAASGGIVTILLAAILGDTSTQAGIELFANQEAGSLGLRVIDLCFGIVGLTLVHTISEGLHGSTLGKRLCGITVVREDGSPAGLGPAFRRSLGFLIDQLFFGLVGAHKIMTSPRAQRVGDLWAGTVVVRLAALDPAARRSWPRLLAATGAALMGGAALGAIVVGMQVAHWARIAQRDQVEIVAVRPQPGAPLVGGQTARFSLTVSHTLRSARDGRLRFYVVHGDADFALQGTFNVQAGRGRTNLHGTARLPESRPGYSDPPLPRFVVELYPARNEDSPSTGHAFELERHACPAPVASPQQICIG
jgi:uncharacterized RDD family membrane protein YckC